MHGDKSVEAVLDQESYVLCDDPGLVGCLILGGEFPQIGG
jgi:hypothetical protein